MGSCCGSSDLTYKFEGKTHQIPLKNAKTIERYSVGVKQRIETDKVKKNFAKLIADLTSPKADISLPKSLMTNKEFEKYMEQRYLENECFHWNNYVEAVNQDGTLAVKTNPKEFLTAKQQEEKMKWNPANQKKNAAQAQVEAHKQQKELAKWKALDKGDVYQYKGEWNKDRTKWEGIGQVKLPDGSLYEGITFNQKPQQKGKMTYSNGDIYFGDWKDGKADGEGIFAKVDGPFYQGAWKQDKQHGKGKEIQKGGDTVYEGDFVEGQKQGKGKLISGKNIYEGDFQNDMFHGQGKYAMVDAGRIYEGQFENNLFHGDGKLTYPDGRTYEGKFVKGKMEGQGKIVLPNGDIWEGELKNDLFHGVGLLTTQKDQIIRQGEWYEGKRVAWLSAPQPLSEDTSQRRKTLYKGAEIMENHTSIEQNKLEEKGRTQTRSQVQKQKTLRK